MPRFSKKKQQIIQLLHSGNRENVQLGLMLAESQQIDLADWWRSVEEIWTLSQKITFTQLPPRAQMLEELQSRTIVHWGSKGLRRLPWAMPILSSLTHFYFDSNPIKDWVACFELLRSLPHLLELRWAGPVTIYWQKHFQEPRTNRIAVGTFETVACSLSKDRGITATNIQAFLEGLNWLYPQLQELHLKCAPRFDFPANTVFPPFLNELLIQGKLHRLPDSIGNLTYLERLVLNDHNLPLLPDTVGQLANLKMLSLQKNRLLELPETIGGCRNMEALLLQQNFLTRLPASLAKLHRLRYLNLSANPIQWKIVLPILAQLPHLETIWLRPIDIAPNELQQLHAVTAARIVLK